MTSPRVDRNTPPSATFEVNGPRPFLVEGHIFGRASAEERRKDYSGYHRILERIFAPISAKPRIAVECDSASSVILEVEAGRGIALVNTILKRVAGKRLLYRSLTGGTEAQSVGIARATKRPPP
jgi:hypothetical protein